jgi:protoporphyrinogen/coproporphyrinogen III oxidase
MPPKVIIIGGGISGLSAAYYLAKRGQASVILESRPRLGGVIQTERIEDCLIEAGPDSFLSAKPAALELARELGLEDQVIGSNDHLRRTYIWKNGRLVALPDGLMMMVPTKTLPLVTTGLLTWGTKIRMGLELLRAPGNMSGDESVAQFVKNHYGAEAVEYLAEPLLSGVYGGDASELSAISVLPRFVELAKGYGSLTRGVLAERARNARPPAEKPAPLFRTLKGGLAQMVDALVNSIRGRVEIIQARAQSVDRSESGFRVKLDDAWLEADRLVIACEAHSASTLLRAVDGRMAELLGDIPYSSSMIVALGFDARDVRHPPDGFGFLVPQKERRRLVACTWVGTKFPYRAPEGTILARCFFGGTRDPEALQLSDEAAAGLALEELRRIAGFRAQPRLERVFRWPRSMAQYTVGHSERIAGVRSRAAAIPGLYLAGNAYEGIGIPDCIRMGREAAERILESAGSAS